MGRYWTEEEKQLVRESKNVEELMAKYLKKYGTATVSRVSSLWSHRSRLLKEQEAAASLSAKQVIDSLSVHVPTRTPAFDDDQVLAHISNRLSETMIELEKEQLIQLQGINSGIIALMELFRRLEIVKK